MTEGEFGATPNRMRSQAPNPALMNENAGCLHMSAATESTSPRTRM